ncbi:MAG: aminotransferase class III-fold pyridoxal phosphate-dependent enzyme [Actinomycetes bacterium]
MSGAPLDPVETVKKYFGIDGSATQLNGERDLNYRITTEVDGATRDYVLKIHQPGHRDWLTLQDRALTALSHLAPHLPIPVRALGGEISVDIPGGRTARLLTWVEGSAWAETETTSTDLRDLGTILGRIDKELAKMEITEPVEEILTREFMWNMMQAGRLSQHVHRITDETLRNVVIEVLEDFREEQLPKLALLPRQMIHNDANDYNIFVSERGIGVIDFGDIVLGAKIIGLAVAASYAAIGHDDPVKALLPLVRGYHITSPLSPSELELLLPLTKVRLAMSVVNAAVQSAADPTNEYLNISQGVIPALLLQLHATDFNHSLFRFRDACGYEGNPNSRAVRQYLSTVARRADVVCPPFKDHKYIYLDWSVENTSIPRWSEDIANLMASKGADVAIGHYCENRNVYQGDAYNTASPSARTIHLGVDLFLPAGSPVYSALDGVVDAFNDNNTPLDYGPVILLRHETTEGIPFWTLYGHLSRESLPKLSVGMKVNAGDQIATIGQEHENVGWPPHTHFQLLTDLCGMGLDVYGVAPKDEISLWRSISPNPNLALGIASGTDAHAHLATDVIREDRTTVLSRNLSLNFRTPLEIVRGEGAYLYDVNGKAYLDLVNNVAHVGHGHPRVVAAGAAQMAALNTNTRYLHQNIVEYARALTSTLPDPLSVVFFVNSGSEANDLAIRLARAHTKARGFIALKHAYHGHTASVVDISPYKFLGKGGLGAPDHVRVANLPDPYRGVHKGDAAGSQYAADFAATLADLNQPLAAFISEGIVSTAGQIVLADGFLKNAYEQVRAVGGLAIADEVQIGLGRVGNKFWGFELHDVVPDIVTMGKPLGNGHPLAAVVTTPEVAASFHNGMEYFNTFGGNPVSAAIGLAVLEVVQDGHLQANAINMGKYLTDGVREMSKRHSMIGDVRGSGLFIGVELMRDEKPATEEMGDLIEYAKERGVFLSCDGPDNNVLKIKPPMVLTTKDVDLFLNIFDEGLGAVKR